jgi:hypothetical protein
VLSSFFRTNFVYIGDFFRKTKRYQSNALRNQKRSSTPAFFARQIWGLAILDRFDFGPLALENAWGN